MEGLPGSGKTTTTKTINKLLSKNRYKALPYYEGDLNHPADYDGTAFLTTEELKKLLDKNPNYTKVINENIKKVNNGYLIEYAKAAKNLDNDFSQEFLKYIFKYDIYELPLEKNYNLITNRWKNFVKNFLSNKEIYIFECCFIQNPITVSMIKHNKDKNTIKNYIHKLNDIIKPLNPILIYLNQNNFYESFNKLSTQRPREWLNYFIDYYTNQGFGLDNNLKGMKGVLEILEKRKEIELEIVQELDVKKYIINYNDYSEISAKITSLIL